MSYTIAISGKGGTGKTTIAALLVRVLAEKKLGTILAVDADPNSNLGEALGLNVEATIGTILDEIAAYPDKVPAGMSKDRFIEYQVHSAISEGDGFELLTMGRPEGPGCYCYVNNCLRDVMGRLIKDYGYVIIDNEAGLEHLSRRTTRSADTLLVVSDATVVGLRAAGRIKALVNELKIKTKKSLLLLNRCLPAPALPAGRGKAGLPVRQAGDDNINIEEKLANSGLDYIGFLPRDSGIEEISLKGASLFGLDENAESIVCLRKIGERIWQ